MMEPDERRVAYDGKLIDVVVERWGEHEREIVEHPGAVAIVAVDRDDNVVLVRQRREAARKELVEIPAGKIDEGEEPLATAKRELAEETGLSGGEWNEVAAFWTTPGFCRERITVFVAEGVESGGEQSLDDGEEVEVVRWPVGDIPSRLGELEDAKTLAGLLLYLRLREAAG
jgi:ADP-ribose pyrophosphatase